MGGTAHHTTPQAAVSNRSDIDIKIDIDIDIDIDVVVVSVSRFPTVSSSTVLHYLGANPVQRVFSTFCIELAPHVVGSLSAPVCTTRQFSQEKCPA